MANTIIPNATSAQVQDTVLPWGEAVVDRDLRVVRVGDSAIPGGMVIGPVDTMLPLLAQGIRPIAAAAEAAAQAASSKADAAAAAATHVDQIVVALADATVNALTRAATANSITTRVGAGAFLDEGTDVVKGALLAAHTLTLKVSAGAATLRYRMWSRPRVSTEAVGPGDGLADALILDFAVPLAGLPTLVPDGPFAGVTVAFPTLVEVREGYSYGFEVWATDGSGARVVMGQGLTSGDYAPARRQTWVRSSAAAWLGVPGQSIAGTVLSRSTAVSRDISFNALKAEARGGIAQAQAGVQASAATITDVISKVGSVTRSDYSYGYPLTGDLPSGQDRTYFVDRPLGEGDQLLSVSGLFTTAGDGFVVVATARAVDGVMTTATPIAILPITVAAAGLQTVAVPTSPAYPGGVYPTGSIVGVYGPAGGGKLRLAYLANASPTQYRYGLGAPAIGTEKAVEAVAVHASVRYTAKRVDGRIPDRLAAVEAAVAAGGAGGGAIVARSPQQRVNGVSGLVGDCSRMELPVPIGATGVTFRLLSTAPADFDAVELICAHATTAAPMTIAKAAFAVVGDKARIDGAGVTWLPLTYGGQSGGSAPAISAARTHGFAISDRLAVSSVARTDGGALPLWMAQVHVTAPITPILLGRADDRIDRRPWVDHPAYPRISRATDGDCVTTPSAFTSTTNISTSPMIGIRFYRAGQVVSVASFGDSNANGEATSGITYQGASYVFEAVRDLNDPAGVCYSHFNLGWSGTAMSTYLDRMRAAFEAGLLPDIAVLMPWSNNGIASPLTATTMAVARQRTVAQMDLCAQYGVKPLLTTVMATNAAVNNYGSSDIFRRSYNAFVRAMGTARGAIVADLAAVIDGQANADGQVEKLAGTTTDLAHLNDSGIQMAKAPIKGGITLVGIAKVGAVATTYP